MREVNKQHSILITGATGFVGKPLLLRLASVGYTVTPVVRKAGSFKSSEFVVTEINGNTKWTPVLKGIKTVIHVAAHVHHTSQTQPVLDHYKQTNIDGTSKLANEARKAGVNRFIFISSIKANGEVADNHTPFTEITDPAPTDDYGASKLEAESLLKKACKSSQMQYVIIRPPLVYGPGVKANFQLLMSWIHRGRPVPLTKTKNFRSMIYLENLLDFIDICITHPNAVNQTFLVSDRENLSTRELTLHLCYLLKSKSRIIAIPHSLLNLIARLFGKQERIKRLTSSLVINQQKAIDLLGWHPRLSVYEGLSKTVQHFLESKPT